MGWDAYVVKPGAVRGTADQRLDSALRAAFAAANAELVRRAGFGSDHLRDGELGGSSLEFLERAVSIPCYDERITESRLYWPPETVLKAHTIADWDFPLDDANTAMFALEHSLWETRLFLDVCASHRLGIWFDW